MLECPSLEVGLESQLASDPLHADLESRFAALEAAFFYDPLPQYKRMFFAVSNSHCARYGGYEDCQGFLQDPLYPQIFGRVLSLRTGRGYVLSSLARNHATTDMSHGSRRQGNNWSAIVLSLKETRKVGS